MGSGATLEVKVQQEDLTVRTRKGYRAPKDRQDCTDFHGLTRFMLLILTNLQIYVLSS